MTLPRPHACVFDVLTNCQLRAMHAFGMQLWKTGGFASLKENPTLGPSADALVWAGAKVTSRITQVRTGKGRRKREREREATAGIVCLYRACLAGTAMQSVAKPCAYARCAPTTSTSPASCVTLPCTVLPAGRRVVPPHCAAVAARGRPSLVLQYEHAVVRNTLASVLMIDHSADRSA